MRASAWTAYLVAAALVACASAPPPPPPPPAVHAAEEHDAAPEEPPSASPAVTVDAPERSAPPSSGSYEDALATPERLDVNDDRVHLSDVQLTSPMRGVLKGCGVPWNARVTIRTAVQNGRAIGVTINVRFERRKPAKPPSRAAAKAEAKSDAKVTAKIVACADRAVRAVVWPPSSRRDSFTTEF